MNNQEVKKALEKSNPCIKVLGVRIEKTKVHNGKCAPEGSMFYVAKIKRNGNKYSICQAANVSLFSEEKEDKLKELLKEALMEMIDNHEKAMKNKRKK